jgi:chromosome segregation protein
VQLIFSPGEAPRDFHFIGTLADALNVDAKWERAVEGVLGSSLQAIVVPTPDDAVRAAQWLRENNGGRASFLVAGLHGGSDEVNTITALACRLEERPVLSPGMAEGFRGDLRICDLLGAPQQLVTVLKRTLPQKVNARLAASLEDAMGKSIATGDMYVTLNGDWIASGQFVNAGDARDVEEGAGLLAFKRELRELETRAEALAREVDSASRSTRDARARLVELEDAVVLLNEAIGREERDALAREHSTTNLEQEVERAERHMDTFARALSLRPRDSPEFTAAVAMGQSAHSGRSH